MSIASTYTIRVTPRHDGALLTRLLRAVSAHRLAARQRRELSLALRGEFGPAQQDDVLHALSRH